jgi:hypothetical protein
MGLGVGALKWLCRVAASAKVCSVIRATPVRSSDDAAGVIDLREWDHGGTVP